MQNGVFGASLYALLGGPNEVEAYNERFEIEVVLSYPSTLG